MTQTRKNAHDIAKDLNLELRVARESSRALSYSTQVAINDLNDKLDRMCFTLNLLIERLICDQQITQAAVDVARQRTKAARAAARSPKKAEKPKEM